MTAREIPTSDIPQESQGSSILGPRYTSETTLTPIPKGKRVRILSEEEEDELPQTPQTQEEILRDFTEKIKRKSSERKMKIEDLALMQISELAAQVSRFIQYNKVVKTISLLHFEEKAEEV